MKYDWKYHEHFVIYTPTLNPSGADEDQGRLSSCDNLLFSDIPRERIPLTFRNITPTPHGLSTILPLVCDKHMPINISAYKHIADFYMGIYYMKCVRLMFIVLDWVELVKYVKCDSF